MVGGASPLAAQTIDPDADGSRWAWGENLGWIDGLPNGSTGPGVTSSWEDLTGWMWIENAGWISTACENTSSCGDVDYGVDVETLIANPGVELRGWMWSENLGWISTACENTGSCGDVDYGVEIALGTGELTGRAWSANGGFIAMSCEETGSCSDVDYGQTIGPCPSILAFVTNPAIEGSPVVITGLDLADALDTRKPRIFVDEAQAVNASEIPPGYNAATILWNQTLAVGVHPVRVQHQSGCLSDPVAFLTVIPDPNAASANSAGAVGCGLLGIEPLALIGPWMWARRRRAAHLERPS